MSVPTFGASLAAQRRLQALLLRRGRLPLVALLLLAVPVASTAALLGWGRGVGLFDDVLEVVFRFLLPFLPALALGTTLSDAVEGGLLPYAFARPAARTALPLGRLLAVVPALAGGFAIAVALSYLLAMSRGTGADLAEGLPHLLRAAGAAALGALVYGAIALAASALFRRHPLVALAAWVLAVEAGMGAAPSLLALLSMSWHLRNLGGLPHPPAGFTAPVAVSPLVSLAVLLAVTALALAASALRTAALEAARADLSDR